MQFAEPDKVNDSVFSILDVLVTFALIAACSTIKSAVHGRAKSHGKDYTIDSKLNVCRLQMSGFLIMLTFMYSEYK